MGEISTNAISFSVFVKEYHYILFYIYIARDVIQQKL